MDKMSEKDALSDRVLAPAGGKFFEDGNNENSNSSMSSEGSESVQSDSSSFEDLVGELANDTSLSFVTAKDYSSRASAGSSYTSKLKESSDVARALEDSDSKLDSRALQGTVSLPGSKVSEEEEAQIIQTREDLLTKEESHRAKRFDYLLEQTEIWGHFMQPAYQEALAFSEDKTADGMSSGQSSQAGHADSPLASVSKNKRKKKMHLMTIPDIGHSNKKPDLSSAPKYVTHFDESPSYIKVGQMRDYQVRGLNWMISLYEKGLSGILADEMGLGKTIQSISLLGYLKHYRGIDGPHLVIAPKSTLANWMNEINKWCPSLKAICLIGSKDERPSFIKKSFLPKRWNVCVTSYEMAKIEKSTLAKVNYHYIIIDEAQKIKNENTILSTCVRKFQSSARLLLTGTPLQNNLHELWALLNFLLPDVFSSSEDFDSWFNEGNFLGNQNMIDRLHAVLRPFLLRRIKSDVEKTLPPKTEMRIYVQMTAMQREWYKKILLNDIEVISSSTGKPTKKTLHNIIMQLRKVCNHPYLFEGAEPQPFTTDSHLITNCGKMIILDKLLLKLKSQGSRVLLFSQMVRMLDILEDYCIWRGFDYCRLDGNTEYDFRQEDIDAFNAPGSSKFIYLLSTRAGGLGINLATANIVIIYDSDWNPQMDIQAMDRAHRIGQTKEVKVFRLVVQDTAEEKIVERAAAKLHLDRMVIQKGRLVGANSGKLPDAVEMLSVVRFGAEKVLKGGKNEGITDADIDTILAQSKIRSEEMDRRLNGMNEDNLRELTIEQVELNWETKHSANENSVYDFEGENYRELRKRKKIFDDDLILVEQKRRKDMSGFSTSLLSHSSKEGLMTTIDNDPNESWLSASDNNDETVDYYGFDRDYAMKTPVSKPPPPLDFQFCPPYVWEFYWRRVDYFRKMSADCKLDHLLNELPLQDILDLKTAEMHRLQNIQQLSPSERREMRRLRSEGYGLWMKNEYKLFLKAMLECGPENLEAVAEKIPGKEVGDVVNYSKTFWTRCHELMNFEQVMKRLNRPELIEERRAFQQSLLDQKIKNNKDISELTIVYEPYQWIGQRFGIEDDIQLLKNIREIGMSTPNVFEVLRCQLAVSRPCSPFLRCRTKDELHCRFNLLMYMIERESKVGIQPSSATSKQNESGADIEAASGNSGESPKHKKRKVIHSLTDEILII